MRCDAPDVPLLERAGGLAARLAVHERNAIRRVSQVESCGAGDVLQQAKTRSRSAILPITAVLSIVRPLSDGRSIAVGLVGNEGVCGLGMFLEPSMQSDEVVVQSAGFVYSIPADDLRHLFEGTPRLQKLILQFAGAFVDQVAMNVVCARYHDVAQRLAKWLLMIDDRCGRIAVASSAALMASALAAPGEEIDETLSELISRGAIARGRSTISIRRDVLEVAACECYESVRIGNGADSR